MKNSKKILAGILAAVMTASVAPMTVSAAWNRNTNGSWSWTENGQTAKGWKFVQGNWYYFDNNGTMATGWRNDGGKWYYLNESGAMATGWKSVGGKWYYLNNSGDMATGWKAVNGKWYHMDNSGAMSTGWLADNGKWYYLDNWGSMATGWRLVDNTWYYMDNSGMMKTGFFTVGNKTYFSSGSGAMQTGVVEVNGKVYYFGESNDGAMQTGKVEIDGKTYTFGEDGAAIGSKPSADKAFTVSESGAVAPATPGATGGSGSSSGGSIAIPSRPSNPDTSASVDTLDELKAALSNDDITTINMTGDITVPAGDSITVPSDKQIVVENGVTLTLGDFDAVTGKVTANAGATVEIVDWEETHTMIGENGLNVTSGAVNINFGESTVTTIPAGTIASVKGTYMDAGNGNDAYRIPKADQMIVNGTLNVDYKMEVAGTMTVNGTVNAANTDVLNTVEKLESFAGKVVANPGATISITDDGINHHLIGADTLSPVAGAIEIKFASDSNEITIPEGTVANVKGTYMDAGDNSDAYRVPKADKMIVDGTLNVVDKMEVAGVLTVNGAVEVDGTLATVKLKSGLQTGALELNGDLDNNGELVLAEKFTGDGNIWTTSGATLTIAEETFAGKDGYFALGAGAELQVGNQGTRFVLRRTDKKPGDATGDAVTAELKKSFEVASGEVFLILDQVNLNMADSTTLTLKEGATWQIYGNANGGKISNVASVTGSASVSDENIQDGVLSPDWFNETVASGDVVLTSGQTVNNVESSKDLEEALENDGGIVNVTGDITVSDDKPLEIKENTQLNVTGNLNVEGTMEVKGELNVSGTMTIANTLTVAEGGTLDTTATTFAKSGAGLVLNGDLNNNGTVILGKVFTGSGSIWTTGNGTLTIGEETFVGEGGKFTLGAGAKLQSHVVDSDVLEHNFRKDGVGPGAGEASTAGNVTVTLNESVVIPANVSFGVFDNVTLNMTEGNTITLQEGSRFQMYGGNGAQITNLTNEGEIFGVTVSDGVLTGSYIDTNSVSPQVVLTGGKVEEVKEPSISMDKEKSIEVSEKLFDTGEDGIVTDETFTEKMGSLTSITASVEKGDVDYEKVLFEIEVTGGNKDNLQLIAFDGSNYWDVAKNGTWGTPGGFKLENASTTFYLVSDQQGTYTVTVKLIDKNNEDKVLATAEGTITVTAVSLEVDDDAAVGDTETDFEDTGLEDTGLEEANEAVTLPTEDISSIPSTLEEPVIE